MDIVRFKGGLGNQMFQYALVEALRARGRNVGCSLGFYDIHPELMPFVLDKYFPNIVVEEVSDVEFYDRYNRWLEIKKNSAMLDEYWKKTKRIFFYQEKKVFTYDPAIFLTKDCCFTGYWQTEKYFKDVREILLKRFAFYPEEKHLLEIAKAIKSENCVSVHVRRKDYVGTKHDIITKEYYKRSVDYIKNAVPDSKFIFFSDDIRWVKDRFGELDFLTYNREEFQYYEDWIDMYLMSICKHNIIANSTFSWWGAWLNTNPEKIVIAPERWIKDNEPVDIWCDDWVKIGV